MYHDDDSPSTWRDDPGKYRWEICDRCRGHGKHVNPNVDGHGLSREDFDEDPDFAENYFSGMYDVSCHDCGGLGRVKVPIVSRLSFGEKRELVAERRRAQWAAESAWERRRESMMLGEY